MSADSNQPRQSWLLQLSALALWTIVTCFAAYKFGYEDAKSEHGSLVIESYDVPRDAKR